MPFESPTNKLIQTFSIIADLTYRVSAFPKPSDEAAVTESKLTLGGGYSTLIAAKRLGFGAEYGGFIGEGPISELVVNQLRKDKIPFVATPALSDSEDLGICSVVVDPTSERTFFTHRGIEQRGFLPKQQILSMVTNEDDWIVCSGYTVAMDQDYESCCKRWRELGHYAKTIFDPSPAIILIPRPVIEALVSNSSMVSASLSEAQFITGKTKPEDAALDLAARGPETIIRCGLEGSYIASPDSRLASRIEPYIVHPVDSNAAGETHIGATVAALATGVPTSVAASFANLCAALSTLRVGPGSCPEGEELLNYTTSLPQYDAISKSLLSQLAAF